MYAHHLPCQGSRPLSRFRQTPLCLSCCFCRDLYICPTHSRPIHLSKYRYLPYAHCLQMFLQIFLHSRLWMNLRHWVFLLNPTLLYMYAYQLWLCLVLQATPFGHCSCQPLMSLSWLRAPFLSAHCSQTQWLSLCWFSCYLWNKSSLHHSQLTDSPDRLPWQLLDHRRRFHRLLDPIWQCRFYLPLATDSWISHDK